MTMKKLILILFVLATHLPMVAQDYKIVHDEISSDGQRIILCNMVNTRAFTDKQVFFVGLNAAVNTREDGTTEVRKSLCLQVNAFTDYEVKKGMVLLVKTIDNEVIELYANAGVQAKINSFTHALGETYTTYGAIVNYEVSENDIAKLKKGIVKFRQETFTGRHEKEYKKEKHIQKVTDVIINHDKLINEALATEKAFDSDF